MIIVRNKLKFNIGDKLCKLADDRPTCFNINRIEIELRLVADSANDVNINSLQIQYFQFEPWYDMDTDYWQLGKLVKEDTKELFKSKTALKNYLLTGKIEEVSYEDLEIINSFRMGDPVWFMKDNKLNLTNISKISIDMIITKNRKQYNVEYNDKFLETYQDDNLVGQSNLYNSKEELLDNLFK